MSTNNLIVHYSEGKYECPLCHRKFNVFNKIKKNIWERRTMASYISNRPNAERHLRACEKLSEELRHIINPFLKKPKPKCREGYD